MIETAVALPEFETFSKIPRLSRDMIVTEKIDGTNAQIYVTDDGRVIAGSRTRWIYPGKNTDNAGFAAWCAEHESELLALGPGRHFGEWWGSGIQRGYGLSEKRFSLFNVSRWHSEFNDTGNGGTRCIELPLLHVVPVLYRGEFNTTTVTMLLDQLDIMGSEAAPGFARPEGVVVYHAASGALFKKTLEKDAEPKAQIAADAARCNAVAIKKSSL
jgi:hypothetical protein